MPSRARAAPRASARARQENIVPPLDAALAVLLQLMSDAESSGHVRVMAAKAVLSQAIQPTEQDKMTRKKNDDSRARAAAIGAITQLLEELAAAKSAAPEAKPTTADDNGDTAAAP